MLPRTPQNLTVQSGWTKVQPRPANPPTSHISSRNVRNASRVERVPRLFQNFFRGIALNPSLTGLAQSEGIVHPTREFAMSEADYEAAVAAYLSTRGVTRCPTVCAVPTQATVADADRAAYRDYIAAQETARLEKLKSA